MSSRLPIGVGITPAFRRSGDGWVDLEDAKLPRRLRWTRCFRGQRRGTLASKAGKHGHRPAPGVKVRFPRAPAWGSSDDAKPSFVVTTSGSCADPDGWKPTEVSRALREKLLAKVHEDTRGDSMYYDSNTEKYLYPDSAVRVDAAYRSAGGDTIVVLKMDGPGAPPPDEFEDDRIDSWTFGIPPSGDIVRLYTLVDLGDFDGDGKSELVFQLCGQDLFFWELVWDHFRSRVRYTVSFE